MGSIQSGDSLAEGPPSQPHSSCPAGTDKIGWGPHQTLACLAYILGRSATPPSGEKEQLFWSGCYKDAAPTALGRCRRLVTKVQAEG